MKLILRIFLILFFATGIFLLGRYSYIFLDKYSKLPLNISEITTEESKPLEIYTIDNLSKADIKIGIFVIGSEIESNDKYTSNNFSFEFNSNPNKSTKKTTSGLINIPVNSSKKPIIIMLRGYVDQEIYKTGMGTIRASEIFAQDGFITVAPDFLGYANSDKEAGNIFESRFQTYVTVLSLIKSLNQIEKWDGNNILIWGHSNGGQIALTILEITSKNYPTTLWAPVSKPFPYSILYYTDESEDRGKLIRSELAIFESKYDVELYSLDNYLDKITATIQLHQGTKDDSVPLNWSNTLNSNLTGLNIDVNYHTYPNADHNMRPDWDMVVSRDLEFFKINSK